MKKIPNDFLILEKWYRVQSKSDEAGQIVFGGIMVLTALLAGVFYWWKWPLSPLVPYSVQSAGIAFLFVCWCVHVFVTPVLRSPVWLTMNIGLTALSVVFYGMVKDRLQPGQLESQLWILYYVFSGVTTLLGLTSFLLSLRYSSIRTAAFLAELLEQEVKLREAMIQADAKSLHLLLADQIAVLNQSRRALKYAILRDAQPLFAAPARVVESETTAGQG